MKARAWEEVSKIRDARPLMATNALGSLRATWAPRCDMSGLDQIIPSSPLRVLSPLKLSDAVTLSPANISFRIPPAPQIHCMEKEKTPKT